MINYLTFIAVAAIGLTVASVPALAKSRGAQLGYGARAQAIESVTDGVSRERAQALRDCNDLSAPYRNSIWGNWQSDIYRSCMAQRGQQE